MRKFRIQEFDGTNGIESIVTEEEIRRDYFPYWLSQMQLVHPDKPELQTFESCLEDWITVHWAIAI